MRILVVGVLAVLAMSEVETNVKMSLDDRLDERIVINTQYKKEYVESITDEKHAELLKKCEAGVADAWVNLLKYVKASKDQELKRVVLRLEYREELRSFGYDKEYAESPRDLAKADRGLQEYEEKIRQIASPIENRINR